MASVRIESINENSSFKQVTIVEKPDLFRLEILALFGKTVGVLISDGDKVFLRTSRDEMVFKNASGFNLSYFYPGIPPEISTDVLTDILLGKVPFGIWNKGYSLGIDNDSRMFTIKYLNSIDTQTILFVDPVKKRVDRAVVNLDNDRTVQITYGDFITEGEASFPREVEISSEGYLLKMSYVNSIKINPRIDRKLFQP